MHFVKEVVTFSLSGLLKRDFGVFSGGSQSAIDIEVCRCEEFAEKEKDSFPREKKMCKEVNNFEKYAKTPELFVVFSDVTFRFFHRFDNVGRGSNVDR